ncbi:flavin reductase [Polymorphum gilvum]|nr:flavin reductase [Polymorphum gilvum]
MATAVHIVTTDGAAGRFGATVSAVCSVTDTPPCLLVCLNRTSRVHAAILSNGVFCVSTLPAGAEPLADAFAGRTQIAMDERFALARWDALATGAPALATASVNADCKVLRTMEMGTHSIIVGALQGVRYGAVGETLVYKDRAYRAL